MKLILILTLAFTSSFALAQNFDLERCGKDNEPVLNKNESEFFNYHFKDRRGDFNFENKRVMIREGNWGEHSSSKIHYFDLVKTHFYKPYPHDPGAIQLIVLTEEDGIDDYDALVVNWSKVPLQNHARNKTIGNAFGKPSKKISK